MKKLSFFSHALFRLFISINDSRNGAYDCIRLFDCHNRLSEIDRIRPDHDGEFARLEYIL